MSSCDALGQVGGERSVVLEEEGVANLVASLLKELTERLRQRGGILSAKQQHAIVDVDQASSIVIILGVLGAGDDNLDRVSSVREERAGVTLRRLLMLVRGRMVQVGQDLTEDLVAQTIDLGEI